MSRFSSSACSKTILPLLGLLFAIPFSEPLKGQEVSPFQPRIVGGQVAEQDEFPRSSVYRGHGPVVPA